MEIEARIKVLTVLFFMFFKEVQTKAVKVRKNESEINKDVLHYNIRL